MPSVPNYIFAHRGQSLYVNLFIACSANIKLDKGQVSIRQETNYPWDGEVLIHVDPKSDKQFALYVRIPGWAQNQPMPGDLYRFADNDTENVTLTVNGKLVDLKMDQGYAVIDRKWQKGDVVKLNLPMPVRRVLANEKVKDDRNKVALIRGPLTYCAEGADNEGGVLNRIIPDDAQFKIESRPDLLHGITEIKVQYWRGKSDLIEIPYYAWSHRGPGEMTVWLNRK